MERGFREKELEKTTKKVAKMGRNELLRNQARENKDPQTILASTWHPELNAIQSTLKNNFHLISNVPKLSNIFKQKPTVTYQKNKSLSDYLLKNDIANQQATTWFRHKYKYEMCICNVTYTRNKNEKATEIMFLRM